MLNIDDIHKYIPYFFKRLNILDDINFKTIELTENGIILTLEVNYLNWNKDIKFLDHLSSLHADVISQIAGGIFMKGIKNIKGNILDIQHVMKCNKKIILPHVKVKCELIQIRKTDKYTFYDGLIDFNDGSFIVERTTATINQ